MAKQRLIIVSAVLAMVAATEGCTTTDDSPRTMADVMREHAADKQEDVELQKEIAQNWEQAQSLIESGKNDLKEGREKVETAEEMRREGQDQIQRGESKIVQGNEQADEARRRFELHFPGLEVEPELR